MFAAIRTQLRHVRQTTNRRGGFIAALFAFIIVILVAAPQAQQVSYAPTVPGTGTNAEPSPTEIDLIVGRSTIINVGAPIQRVSLTVPDIADAMVTTPSQLLIHGKTPGTISLFVWDRGGTIKTYEVKVRRDLTPLVAHMKQLFPGEDITVIGSGKDVVLSGTVSGQYVIDKAANVAAGYVEKKENVVNLLKQQEGVASNQVMLRVRFAEVSRNALQELGASAFSDGNNNFYGRTTTQQFGAPNFDQNHPSAWLGQNAIFSDYLNLFLFDTKNHIGAVVKALQTKGNFQSLAEPNLIALNGKEASFLAGGEFPYPVPSGQFGSFTIHFKEFGVRLRFTPTVLGGDLINLKIAPEVSTLDFNNAVILDGFRVPALSTRRAETEVELRDGQTFAIAGLMNNTALSSMRKVPGLGDIPVLGLLFRSRAYQKEQTELVVMVTPHIVRRDSTGVSEGLPSLVEPYLGPNTKPVPNPAPYVGSPAYPLKGQTTRPGGGVQPMPQSQNQPLVSRPITEQPAQVTSSVPVAPRPQMQAEPTATAQPVAEQPMATPAPRPLTKDEMKAIEKAREEERKAAVAAERERLENERREAMKAEADARAAEKARVEQARRDAEAKKQADKLEKERAKKQAEIDKKNAEVARKKAEEDAKRQKTLDDAAMRLKAAQAAYQAEVEKQKKGGVK